MMLFRIRLFLSSFLYPISYKKDLQEYFFIKSQNKQKNSKTIVFPCSSSSGLTFQYETHVVNLFQVKPYAVPPYLHHQSNKPAGITLLFIIPAPDHAEENLYPEFNEATNSLDFWI